MYQKEKWSLLIVLSLFAISCTPKAKVSSQVDLSKNVADMAGFDESRKLELTRPGSSPYEQYIQRWDDIAGATINTAINEKSGKNITTVASVAGIYSGYGRIWMVGVQAVRPDAQVIIDPKVYGKGTSSIPFNWFKDKVVGNNVDAPMPLVAPIIDARASMFPNDPAIVYNNARNSTEITLVYAHMIENTANKNGAGRLDLASAWSGITPALAPGDKVDLVVYMYTTEQNYNWYVKKIGLNPENTPTVLQSVVLDHVIELQRFPMVLQ